ncbi:Uncharacterized protein BP5553_00493 [Venustampulla echinocandica]|uniref:Azaphilone pigments biosynthesis cluster protein L N-terminal domain-containing protein n=1 Tax=Venustampulla echinocandica TaxID=2656787 RepID=A0A370TYC6_9HELO|nr:Uncharacterized protein BP5553_00493 [Venustampulla echinocandica]RDL40514.1 Uncharacterized protein BP5553_00493 [Venustampulla echinocandica]
MDPLSISASALTVIAATIASVNALHETVKRYKGRDKTLGRLQGGLLDLVTILNSLEAAADGETPILTLLKGPIGRCSQVCREFEDAMKIFSGKSKTGLKDWTKMEFMRGDISEFIDTLADYKSTITIGLGTITMHASRLTQQVVGEYSEMIKDTSYSLEMRLERIDEKITSVAANRPTHVEDLSIDLQDEKAVTVQCLRICERASSYISSLQDEQPALQREAPQQSARYALNQFESQVLTQNSLKENRDNLLETIGRLRERLDSITPNTAPDGGRETLRLQEEIDFSKQCLEVCKQASNQVSSQKIHIIGEVIADGDCDQVVVTTLADLFNVGKVKAMGRSAQLVGSMEADVLRDISKDRYASRFGALGGSLETVQLDTAAASPPTFETPKAGKSFMKLNQAKEDEKLAGPETTYDRPSPNEVRRRTAGGEDGAKKTGHE